MRMRGRGQAPASFLLGPLFMKCEALPASRRGSLPVPLLPAAWMVPQPARCTGGVRGAGSLLGSLVSTFGHFLRGTLSSDSLGTPYFLGFCSLYCPRYSASCARSAQKLLSPERFVPKLPVKPRAAPPAALPLRPATTSLRWLPFLCVLRSTLFRWCLARR